MSEAKVMGSPSLSAAGGSVPLLRARGLRLSFGFTEALRGIHVDVHAGEVMAITGPSGSGKSTLLHVLAGVLVPDHGTVEYKQVRLTALDEAGRSRLRLGEFGFVFQYGQLLPDLSAVDNVTIPLLLAGTKRREALRRAEVWLERLGVAEHSGKLPAQLSGGQAQRVAVARALATEPAVLFADEPTGSLDSLAAENVMLALTEAARATGTTVVLITHDPRTAAYADRELIVRDGQITFGGPTG
ncbi:ABC transporter ATP-binding protein [Plantactinospora sp. S1510]|uniref:ABC transporter ATP-binding protein n=1 Tax=Plantactinospora alkalitolerans TaxID=2789879 RepID=A0ABS0H9K8_9ACTN|nr:ABC transporter ATP-binding protein [Plantactinospora alkalitolerans]MBF9134999.1 ABC transporter ATP-binding protein [Plantactinospora alkalitolerans]